MMWTVVWRGDGVSGTVCDTGVYIRMYVLCDALCVYNVWVMVCVV